jgi:hypothetical protein
VRNALEVRLASIAIGASLVGLLVTAPATAAAQLPPPPPPPPGDVPPAGPLPSPRRSPREPVITPAPAARVASRREPVYAERERAPREDYAPPARTGFQLALRTGYAFRFGRVTAATGGEMSDTFSGQVPVLVEGGAKLTPHLFVGGYTSFAFGDASGAFHRTYCSNGRSCTSTSFRIGAEAQYHFLPAERLNPWVGYGIGYESTGVTASSGGTDLSIGYSGLELAHLTAGLDVRLSRILAVGPVADFGIGSYGSFRQSQNGNATDGSVANGAAHEWLMLGARVTFLP